MAQPLSQPRGKPSSSDRALHARFLALVTKVRQHRPSDDVELLRRHSERAQRERNLGVSLPLKFEISDVKSLFALAVSLGGTGTLACATQ